MGDLLPWTTVLMALVMITTTIWSVGATAARAVAKPALHPPLNNR